MGASEPPGPAATQVRRGGDALLPAARYLPDVVATGQ